jgi:hypothetical protein
MHKKSPPVLLAVEYLEKFIGVTPDQIDWGSVEWASWLCDELVDPADHWRKTGHETLSSLMGPAKAVLVYSDGKFRFEGADYRPPPQPMPD